MDFFDVVLTQRAMRRLTPDPIPPPVLRQILEAALCAPSGGNRQAWRFVVVQDAAVRARLGALYREAFTALVADTPQYRDAAAGPRDTPDARMIASALHLAEHMGEAPVIVAACIATGGAPLRLSTGASIYPAVQNLMLAARALGIGSTLTTAHHRYRHPEVKALLGIPDDVEVAALVPLGHPRGRFGRPPRRPLEEVAYTDRWNAGLR